MENHFNNFDKRLFSALYCAFIIATIIGTLSHESGHYFVGECLGLKGHIGYEYTWFENSYPGQITTRLDNIFIILGGPLETMLTGTIGLIMLYIFRKTFINKTKLSIKQWVMIFATLCWLRPLTNLIIWLGKYFFTGTYSQRMDEINLAHYFQLPLLTIAAATGIIGAIVLAIVILKFIPKSQRITFIFAGLSGGISGYILWLIVFGKMILP